MTVRPLTIAPFALLILAACGAGTPPPGATPGASKPPAATSKAAPIVHEACLKMLSVCTSLGESTCAKVERDVAETLPDCDEPVAAWATCAKGASEFNCEENKVFPKTCEAEAERVQTCWRELAAKKNQ